MLHWEMAADTATYNQVRYGLTNAEHIMDRTPANIILLGYGHDLRSMQGKCQVIGTYLLHFLTFGKLYG